MRCWRRFARAGWRGQGRQVPSRVWVRVAPDVEVWHDAGQAVTVLARWKP